MTSFRFWNKSRSYRRQMLLQQLEERIVLDAAVGAQDNPNNNTDGDTSHADGNPALPSDAADTTNAATPSGGGDGNAGLAADVPDSFDQVFNKDLNVVLVADNLTDVSAIRDAADPDAKMIVYDAEQDGLATIAAKLQEVVDAAGQKIDNLAVVGHSSEGILSIGVDQIQFFSLSSYQGTFEALGQTLSQDGQIQFYGCYVAADDLGKAMVDTIATYTAAEAFASTNATGGASQDWKLEYASDPAVAMHAVLDTDALAAAGTELVAVAPFKEIQASTAGGWSGNADNPLFINVDGKMFFKAGNNGSNYELYVCTDGTAAGTGLVLDINTTSGTASSLPNDFVSYQGKLFFTADDGIHGRELWVSDGTPGGTYLFADINPTGTTSGFGTAGANNFTVFDGKLYFTGNDGANGTELWVTDGVYTGSATVDPAHTHMVVATGQTAGAGSSTISNLTVVNDTLYYVGIGSTALTKNLWMTDGITDPVQVSTVANNIASMVNFNGTLFFSGTGNGLGQELWMSDGTSAGTTMFADIYTGSSSSSPANFTVIDDYLFFIGYKIPGGSQILGTDGVSAPTTISAPGAYVYTGIKPIGEAGGMLFWGEASSTTTNTPQLWMYDPANGLGGTAVNLTQTVLNGVTNIGMWPTPIANALDSVYFSYASSTYGWEVFDYDVATGVITQHPADTGGYSSSGYNAMYPVFVNGSVFWQANTSTYGRELYRDAVAPWETAAQAPVNTLGTPASFAEDTAGLVDLSAAFVSVSDPDGDFLRVKLVASAGFSGITLDDGATFHKAITLTGDAATLTTTLHNLKGQLKPDFFGTAEVDITTTDPSGWSDTDRVFFTVTPVPDAPTITLPTATPNYAEDQYVSVPLALANASSVFTVYDGDPGDMLTLTASVIPGQGYAGVNLTDSAGTFGLSDSIIGTWDAINAAIVNKIFVKTEADFNGVAQLLFTVSDGVNPPVSATYDGVTLTAVNDTPVNNNVATVVLSTDEDTPAVFSTGNGNLISISDVDIAPGGPENFTVTLTTAQTGIGDTGTVHVVATGDPLLTIVGNDTSVVTLTGPIDKINAALDGMSFIPYAENYDYSGTSNAKLTIVTSDGGNIGTGGVLSATDVIDFTVAPVADAPVNTVGSFNVPAGTSMVSLAGGISVHDADVNDTLFVSVTAGTGVSGLSWGTVPSTSPQFVFSGMETFLSPLLNNLTAHLQPGFYGLATVEITTTDLSGLSTPSTLPINVATASLPPDIIPGAVGYTVYEDHAGPVNLGLCVTVSDPNSDPLTVDLVASAGWSALNAAAQGSASVTGGGTASLHITGSMVDVQSTLATLNGTLTADFNGTASFDVTASDGTNPAVSTVVDVPIIAVNDGPVLTVPGAQSGNPNTPISITGISVADLDVDETAAMSNVVYVQLDVTNGTLVLANTNGLTFDAGHGDGSSSVWFTGNLAYVGNALATVTYTPSLNYSGPDSLSVTVDDMGHTGQPGALSAADAISIDVIIPPLPPEIIPGAVGYTVYEDHAGPVNLGSCVTVSDPNSDPLTVDLVASAGWSGLSATASGAAIVTGGGSTTLQISGSMVDVQNTLATLNGTLIANFNGTASFDVTASDGTNPAVSTVVDVPIIAVNDGPVLTVPGVQSGNPNTPIAITGISVADLDVDETAPMSNVVYMQLDVTNGTLELASTNGLTFDAGHGDGTSSVWFTGNLTYLANALATVTYTPTLNYSGPDSLTVMVDDMGHTGQPGALSAADAISIDVFIPPLPPEIIPGAVGYTVYEDHVGAVNLGSCVTVSDPNSDPLTVDLVVSAGWNGLNATASGAAIVTGGGSTTLQIAGSMVDVQNTLATLNGTLIGNFNGTASFDVTASDGINPAVSTVVDVPIIAVNDAPANTMPVAQATNEDTALVFSAATSNAISVSDVDAAEGTGLLQVALSVTPGTGTLTLSQLTNLTIDAGADGTDTVTFTGLEADINAALEGLIFTPAADYNGSVSVTVTTNDLGNSPAPALQAVDTVDVTVAGVNDAPVNTVPIAQATNEGTALVFSAATSNAISVSDVDATEGTGLLQVTLGVTPGTGTLTLSQLAGLTFTAGADGTETMTFTGLQADINAALEGLTFTPAVNYNGLATVTVTTNDLGNSPVPALQAVDTVDITVAALNDAPVVTVPGIVQQNDAAGAVVFSAANGNLISVSDIDAGGGLLKVTLTATHGTITLNGVAGLSFDPGLGGLGDGTADATMTFFGTDADINIALDGMSFNRDAGYVGLADVTVTVDDQGNTGLGGPLTDTQVANISVEPYLVWFQGFGPETGWDVYNYDGGSYYTHDYAAYWEYVNASATWNFWNGTAWVATDALGNAPYDGGFGPYGTWFADTVVGGTYENYDVYIDLGMTYYSPDHTAAGATYWRVSSAGDWGYYDGSAWYATAGFDVEPTYVWFHGYETGETGWDVYNYADGSYYTHDYTVYWQYLTASTSWNFWNGSAWVPTDALGNAPYGDGFGPYGTWFMDTVVGGTYENYDVYIDLGMTYYSPDHTAAGATYWRVSSAGNWGYYDGEAWYATAGFDIEPVNVWFHGYGTEETGWDVYNYADGSYYTQDYAAYWQYLIATTSWNYWNGTAWVPTTDLGVIA